ILALIFCGGFAVEGPRGGADTAIEHLKQAPRWAAGSTAFLETGERSLGGGLEYSIDESVCAMDFVDRAPCSAIHTALEKALEEWGSGHPSLFFIDVTDDVRPAFPLAAMGQAGQGAEIDFFGSTASEFPPFRSPFLTGYTIFYERLSGPYRLTNGALSQAGSRIESADVRFNASRCYYLDPALAEPECVHFPSLVLHEVAHALGIGHPEDRIAMNLDTDRNPSNEIRIDCNEPTRGLIPSIRYDGAAVSMGRDVQGPGRWHRGLTWDDVAARDALYPDCGIQRLERFSGAWGAVAIAEDGQMGRAGNQVSAEIAEALSLARCQQTGGRLCRLVAAFDGCFAYAEGFGGGAGHARSPRSDHARVDAVLACAENGGSDCRVSLAFCAFD
ncbi:MAG: DUF4189 domain-containing protein, partial [Pseudomonadota bacterium]